MVFIRLSQDKYKKLSWRKAKYEDSDDSFTVQYHQMIKPTIKPQVSYLYITDPYQDQYFIASIQYFCNDSTLFYKESLLLWFRDKENQSSTSFDYNLNKLKEINKKYTSTQVV